MSFILIIIIICICCFISVGIGAYIYYIETTDYTLFVPGMSIMSSNIYSVATTGVNTIQDCEKMCYNNSSCQSFAYNTTGKQCTLQQQTAYTNTPTKSYSVGYKLTNGKYTVYDGFTTNDIFAPIIGSPLQEVSQEECQKKCGETQGCYLYKYQYNTNPTQCYLKTLVPNELLTHGNLERKNLESK